MNIKLFIGLVLLSIFSWSVGTAQCPTITDCTVTGWLPDNQTRTLCASPAGGTFIQVVGNGSVSGNIFTPMQRRQNYLAQIAYNLPAPNIGCFIIIDVPVATTAQDCPNVSFSGPSNTTTSVGQTVNTSVSLSGTANNPSWSISPSTGVSQSSGSGTGTGNISFNNSGVYTVTFSVNNDNGVCVIPDIRNFTYTREIIVTAQCSVPVRN